MGDVATGRVRECVHVRLDAVAEIHGRPQSAAHVALEIAVGTLYRDLVKDFLGKRNKLLHEWPASCSRPCGSSIRPNYRGVVDQTLALQQPRGERVGDRDAVLDTRLGTET